MSVFLFICVRLSFSLSICLPLCLSVCHSLWKRANARKVSFETLYGGQFTLPTQLIVLTYPVSVCLSACLPACLSICLFVCLCVCLSICLSVFRAVCLSVSVSVSIYLFSVSLLRILSTVGNWNGDFKIGRRDIVGKRRMWASRGEQNQVSV